MSDLDNITIIPTVYVGKREDGNILLKCLQGDEAVNRAFEPKLLKRIKNPKYIFIGVMTGNNIMGLNACDGSEYEYLYNEKWGILLK